MWHITKINILLTDAQTVLSAAQRFGAGSTPYMVSKVNCTGSEELLAECSHLGVNVHNCGRSQEAGVRCGKNTLPYTFSVFSVVISHQLELTLLLTFD